MATHEILAGLSGLVCAFAFIPYIRMIVKDSETHPSIVSWLIWAMLDTITFTAMAVKHNTNWMIWACVFCAWSVVATIVLCGKAHRTPWDKMDKACGAFGLLAIICWAVFGDSSLGLFWSLTGTFTAAFPTFKRAWHGKEDKLSWAIWTVSCWFLMASFAVAKTWALPIAGQGIVFTVIETTVFLLLFVKPMLRRRSPQVLNIDGE